MDFGLTRGEEEPAQGEVLCGSPHRRANKSCKDAKRQGSRKAQLCGKEEEQSELCSDEVALGRTLAVCGVCPFLLRW